MTRRLTVAGLLVVLAVACRGGCGGEVATGPTKEIQTESIVKQGDTWHVDFVTAFDAPVDKVFDAYTHPERFKEFAPENVLKSDVLKEDGNQKLVDIVGHLDILPPGFKVQNVRIEYTYFPDQKKITSRSIDFKLADINSEYVFTPSKDGKGTTLTFKQTSKDKAPLIVDSLQKGALREQYVTQVRAVNRALGLEPPAKQAG
jgi:hypothetical protein